MKMRCGKGFALMIVCLYVLMGILVGWLGDDCYCKI